jgi:hypothetical protein
MNTQNYHGIPEMWVSFKEKQELFSQSSYSDLNLNKKTEENYSILINPQIIL